MDSPKAEKPTDPAAAERKKKANIAEKRRRETRYWQDNLRLLAILLLVWFVVSYGFGIILAEPLNTISLFGVPLGFWFAQQGSIYTFVVLIFVYGARMKALEKKYGIEEGQ